MSLTVKEKINECGADCFECQCTYHFLENLMAIYKYSGAGLLHAEQCGNVAEALLISLGARQIFVIPDDG